MDRYNFIYSLDNPSGPGDLPLGKKWMVKAISDSEKGLFRFKSCVLDSEGRFIELRNESMATSDGMPKDTSSFKL